MTDVIGPNSYLPGDVLALPRGKTIWCDEHPDKVAVAKIIGETDSMGSEVYNACQECVNASKNAGPTIGICDWCKTKNVEVKPKRDYEEGMNGRVYDVCQPCIKRYDDRQAEEFSNHNPFFDYVDYD